MQKLHFQSEFSNLRNKTGYSINKLAEITGKSLRTIYRWENDETPPETNVIKLMEKIVEKKRKCLSITNDDFTFIDLFAGIGGIRMGFEAANGKCVFTSEWNKFSQMTYRANFFDDHEIAGDITNISENDIPSHDVLLAGFPCQPFSIAGISKKKSLGREHGFRDKTQGTLFFDVARILSYHKPVAFLLENVKNLVSHDRGNTFKIIVDTLEKDLGYFVDYKIIDGKCLVPQHRERIYICGFKRDTGFRLNNITFPDVKDGPKLSTIFHTDDEEPEFPYTKTEVGLPNEKYTLTPRLWDYLQGYALKHKAQGNGFGYGLVDEQTTARTLSARYYKDGSEILIKQSDGIPRRLTPRECARLMGFEKKYGKKFIIPVSDLQAYKQFGNAVVVPVIERIDRAMKPHIILLKNNEEKI